MPFVCVEKNECYGNMTQAILNILKLKLRNQILFKVSKNLNLIINLKKVTNKKLSP